MEETFVADLARKEIHSIDCPRAPVGDIEGTTLPVLDMMDAEVLIERNGYAGCPWCLPRYQK